MEFTITVDDNDRADAGDTPWTATMSGDLEHSGVGSSPAAALEDLASDWAAADTKTLDAMVHAYAVCALWSSTTMDEDPEPLDDFFGPDDLTPETAEEFQSDCAAFLQSNYSDCLEMMTKGFDASQLGHDFWLTRNGHGAGFWDRGLGALGERLADAARVYGGVDLFVTGGDTTPEMVSS